MSPFIIGHLRTWFLAISVLFTVVANIASAEMRLWTTKYASPAICKSYAGTSGPENLKISVEGYEWPYDKGGAENFIDGNARHLNAAATGRANDKAFAERLLSAANAKAFTRLDFGAAGGSSPSFVSAILVESLAYSVSYLRSRNALSASELKTIDVWARKLIKNSSTRAESRDHKAALATSKLAWGAAIDDKRLFDKGKRQLQGILRGLRRSQVFSPDIRNNNEVMQQVIHAGEILWLNGIDVFSQKNGKNSLHMAVAYHANQVAANSTKKIKTSGDPTDPARSIFRSQGYGTHIAWVPVSLSLFPNSGAANEVRALDRALRKVDRKPYWGMQMGVHTGCLFGRGR